METDFKEAKMKNWSFFILLSIFLITSVSAATKVYCGDGICHLGETPENCIVDCRCEPQIVYVDKVITEERTVNRQVPVPFFSKPGSTGLLNETCGYDTNQDGIMCDPNEDFISCPKDCERPSFDSVMCVGEKCAWQEAWFARTLLMLVTGVGIFLFIKSRQK